MRGFLPLFLLLFLVATVQAAPVASREPLTIKSDTLRADNDKKNATFEGKVVARQGDLTLYADRLVISYSGDGKDLSRAEAFGNVRILQGARQASGAHAVYEPKQARIILDGAPKVTQGGDVITGKVITYYVNEQRSEVTGGPGERVNAVIHPGGGKDVKP
ncbi:lipopolysaccharide export system protein LptA [Geomonas silvestris]|uniref:Lipopolysaccharide export system protein LptA n=1 Tax=Geomonas silvestris TaxID=2740184 RepID=A0A6V8MPS4_9BACT|nr:lipopolysaccharide transport periplasmic protein LptA [Geomonas silvestris]GFO61619.1 lipopolysaccharide export system protein LptA [Geomonas silvestris]